MEIYGLEISKTSELAPTKSFDIIFWFQGFPSILEMSSKLSSFDSKSARIRFMCKFKIPTLDCFLYTNLGFSTHFSHPKNGHVFVLENFVFVNDMVKSFEDILERFTTITFDRKRDFVQGVINGHEVPNEEVFIEIFF